MHSDGRACVLRWYTYQFSQPGRPSLEDNHHPSVGASTLLSLSAGFSADLTTIQPELLSGSLRENLDPFHEHDDAVLNDSLRAAGLFSLQIEMDEGKITLDSQIASGGNNLSVGQRQILALARAIVRQSKLLILDEGTVRICCDALLTLISAIATSAIGKAHKELCRSAHLPLRLADYETDTVIQTSLRSELDKDVTLLTIAHRLQTIMDSDKIVSVDDLLLPCTWDDVAILRRWS